MVLHPEINVIDEELLAQALAEEDGNGNNSSLEKNNSSSTDNNSKNQSLVDLIRQAQNLKLSFRHLRKIDNLEGFRNLTKLCLDNNHITKIENMDFLIHLTWLDLSFNKIEKIEGLEKLTKLTDLSLYNNRITEVEGLDNTASTLQCLSIGCNHISSLDSIFRLRKFQKLRLLNLDGNPVCKEAEYRMMVLAFLSCLNYLDYSMAQKEEVITAREQYQSELIDLEKKEAIDREKLNYEAQSSQTTAQLLAANLQVVETLFKDMIRAEDVEMMRLKHLPGFQDLIDNFRASFAAIAEGYKSNGLMNQTNKMRQVEQLESGLRRVREEDVSKQRGYIEAYLKQKKHVVKEIERASMDEDTMTVNEVNNTTVNERRLNRGEEKGREAGGADGEEEQDVLATGVRNALDLRTALEVLYDHLLSLEVYQMDQFEELMNDFEVKYAELKVACLESAQGFFRAIEEQEARFTSNVATHTSDLLDKAVAGEGLPEDITDEAESLLVDREALMELINGAHDNRVSILLKKEDESRLREEAGFSSLVTRYREEEKLRNRHRILELHELFEQNKKQISEMVHKLGGGGGGLDGNGSYQYDMYETMKL